MSIHIKAQYKNGKIIERKNQQTRNLDHQILDGMKLGIISIDATLTHVDDFDNLIKFLQTTRYCFMSNGGIKNPEVQTEFQEYTPPTFKPYPKK